MLIERLVLPEAKGHVSVARLNRYWYVACRSSDLGRKPIARTLLGLRLVLFRNRKGVGALLDRCPHRNVPLSIGRVQGETLECRYHGWRFDQTGACQLVPGLLEQDDKERRVPSCPVREQDGLIWVWPELDGKPTSEPFPIPSVERDRYLHVVREVAAKGSLHATLENALDVPHTAFLHRGLFRGGDKHEIRAVLRRGLERVEVEYVGESRPSGLVGKLLSPSGGTVEHWDRFFLPSVAQVEYRLGSETHLLVTAFGSPVSDFETRLFAVVQIKTLLPVKFVRPLLEPVAMGIFRQDARILEFQSKNIKRFGGEQFMSTELDLMGPAIWRLMKHAEEQNGHVPDPPSPSEELLVEREVRFWA